MRNPFRNQYRELAAQLQSDLEALRAQYSVELAKRISAETLAAERAKEVERVYESLRVAEASRDEVVQTRLKSVDLVNMQLLRPAVPEKVLDPKDYTVLRRPSPKVTHRSGDAKFIQDQLKAQGVIKAPLPEPTPKSADDIN